MDELKAKIQSLREKYIAELHNYLRSSIFKNSCLKRADAILEELKELTNNPKLIGLNVVMGNIPVREVRS